MSLSRNFLGLVLAVTLLWSFAGCTASSVPDQDVQAESGAISEEATPQVTPTLPATPTALPSATPTDQPLLTEIVEEPASPVNTPTAMSADTSAPDLPPGSEQAVAAAIEDLASQSGIAATGEITVQSVEPVEWRDASLGCPQEGMMYAQVITPGFLVMLEAGGEQYEYHTNQADTVVLCQQ